MEFISIVAGWVSISCFLWSQLSHSFWELVPHGGWNWVILRRRKWLALVRSRHRVHWHSHRSLLVKNGLLRRGRRRLHGVRSSWHVPSYILPLVVLLLVILVRFLGHGVDWVLELASHNWHLGGELRHVRRWRRHLVILHGLVLLVLGLRLARLLLRHIIQNASVIV